MKALESLKQHLTEGALYRRHDLLAWSKSVDRHLQELVKEGALKKLRGGLYYKPSKSVFGDVPAETSALVQSFLRDDRFLVTSFNAFNSLGLGTTQLYNHQVVYNYKRRGVFELGGKKVEFRVRPGFPKKASPEFYLVDMLNNLGNLADDQNKMLEALTRKICEFNAKKLNKLLKDFGTIRARKIVSEMLTKK